MSLIGLSLWLDLEAFDELELVDSENLERDPNDNDIIFYAGDDHFANASHIPAHE